MFLPYNRASMQHSELSEMDFKQQINRSPNGQVRLDCQMDQSIHDLFVPTQLTYSEYMNMADDDNEFNWSAGFGNLFEEGCAQQDHHQDGSTNRQEGEWTTEQIQDSTVRSTKTLNSNASTEDHLLSIGNEFDLQMFYNVNRGNRMGSFQSEVTSDPPPIMEHYASKLNKHVPIHQNIKTYQCEDCGKRYAHKGNFVTHVRRHSKVRPYKCELCIWSFYEKRSLERHVDSRHLHIKPYRCTLCDDNFATKSNTILHIRSVHFGLPRTLKAQRARNIIDHRDAREFVEKWMDHTSRHSPIAIGPLSNSNSVDQFALPNQASHFCQDSTDKKEMQNFVINFYKELHLQSFGNSTEPNGR